MENKDRHTRTCLKCRKEKIFSAFAETNSPFFAAHRSPICIECLERMVPATDWDKVDQLFRWLDLPFDPNKWAELYADNGARTLRAYLLFVRLDGHYSQLDWKAENLRWKDIVDKKETSKKLEILSAERREELNERWGDSYTDKEQEELESLYRKIIATQNVSTPILHVYAKDFCELSLRIKQKGRRGEDIKKEMDARDNIIKSAGFEAKNAINVSDFDSVGELMNYYVKKGWMPNWAKEKNDVVDITMNNIQQYLMRLVMNEGGLAEQVEQRKAAYNSALRLEESQTDNDLARFEEIPDTIHFNDEQKFTSMLAKWESEG